MLALWLPLILQTPAETRFEAKLRELFAAAEAPGVTAAFVGTDGKVYSVAVGEADREGKVPMRPSHRMLAGSTGKTFFAAAILRLWDQGKVDLDRPIAPQYAKDPWFSQIPNASTLTLRNLMNHASGVPEHVQYEEFDAELKKNPDRIWKPAEILQFVVGKAPLFEAGKGWSYADTNFILAADSVEREERLDLYHQIDRDLLRPLKLRDTGPSISRRIPNLAVGYSRAGSPFTPEGPVVKDGVFAMNPQFEWAGGGFYSTSADLAKWAYELYAGTAISAKARDAMLTAAVPARTGRDHKYGLGVQVRPSPLGVGHGHGGWFPGYLTEIEYFPDKKIALAIQFNTDDVRKLRRMPRAWLLDLAQSVAAP